MGKSKGHATMMTRFTAPITALILLCAFAVARADGAEISVRYSTAPETVRVVLDLPRAATFTDQSTSRQVQLILDLPLTAALPAITVEDPVVASITVAPTAGGKAQLTIQLAKARKYNVFTLPAQGDRPDRLVVDIFKRFRKEEARALSPAIAYTRVEQQTDDYYRVVHFVEIDTRDPNVHLDVAAAQGERERVSAMVARTGAVCGINGGYFMQGTRPVGLLKATGAILSLPIWGRTAVAFPRAGAPVLGNPRGVWRVTLADGTVRDVPDGLDVSAQSATPDVVAYHGNQFTQAPANPQGLTSLVRNGQVLRCTFDPVPLSPGDFAFRLADNVVMTLDPLLAKGAPVTIMPILDPVWDDFPCAVGAGPRLLRDGKLALSGAAERFKPDILQGHAARSGLGVTAQGTVVLVAVEAPGPYGGGATLEELAGLLKSRGVTDAMNLDGGGSCTLAIGAVTVSYPPGAWVRPVASGILVFDQRMITPSPAPPATPPAPAPPPAASETPAPGAAE